MSKSFKWSDISFEKMSKKINLFFLAQEAISKIF